MAYPILSIVIALTYAAPNFDLQAKSHDPISSCLRANPGIILIADWLSGEDPHGDVPHGADPHDENHDFGLPANSEQFNHQAPQDPYGYTEPNSPQPNGYPPPNNGPY